MKLLEEKGLRNKIINECIKKENQLNDIASVYIDSVNKEKDLSIRLESMIVLKEMNYAIAEIKDLRMNLLVLLDNEKVE